MDVLSTRDTAQLQQASKPEANTLLLSLDGLNNKQKAVKYMEVLNQFVTKEDSSSNFAAIDPAEATALVYRLGGPEMARDFLRKSMRSAAKRCLQPFVRPANPSAPRLGFAKGSNILAVMLDAKGECPSVLVGCHMVLSFRIAMRQEDNWPLVFVLYPEIEPLDLVTWLQKDIFNTLQYAINDINKATQGPVAPPAEQTKADVQRDAFELFMFLREAWDWDMVDVAAFVQEAHLCKPEATEKFSDVVESKGLQAHPMRFEDCLVALVDLMAAIC